MINLFTPMQMKLFKATAANIGEVRSRKDGDWKKISAAKWVKVAEKKTEERQRADAWQKVAFAGKIIDRLGEIRKTMDGDGESTESPLNEDFYSRLQRELDNPWIISSRSVVAQSIIANYPYHRFEINMAFGLLEKDPLSLADQGTVDARVWAYYLSFVQDKVVYGSGDVRVAQLNTTNRMERNSDEYRDWSLGKKMAKVRFIKTSLS